jgi:TonB family protein
MDYGNSARRKKTPSSIGLWIAAGGLAILVAAAVVGLGVHRRSPEAIAVNAGFAVVPGIVAFALAVYILILLAARKAGPKRPSLRFGRILLRAMVIPSAILGFLVYQGFVGIDSSMETSARQATVDRVLARRLSGSSAVLYLKDQGRTVIPARLFASAQVDGAFCLERRQGVLMGAWLEPRACAPAEAKTLPHYHDIANWEPPKVLEQPTKDELAAAYPQAARSQGIAGEAVVRCTITPEGVPTDCQAKWEKPVEMGFGAAAASVAPLTLVQPGPAGRQAHRRPVRPAGLLGPEAIRLSAS